MILERDAERPPAGGTARTASATSWPSATRANAASSRQTRPLVPRERLEDASRHLTPATPKQGERADRRLQLRERRLAFDTEASDPTSRRAVEARIIGSGVEEHEREGVLEIEPAHLSCGELGVEKALALDGTAEAG